MNTRRLYTPIIMAAIIMLPTALHAQDPLGTVFTYQGQLKQAGVPVTGDTNFVFHVCNAEVGGTVLDSVSVAAVPVADGLFTVTLDFDVGVFNGDARWLEIEVDGTTLSPRQLLTAAPYALYALNGGGSSPWETVGGDIYYDAGHVGIGTAAPIWPLQVDSSTTYCVHGRNRSTSGAAYAGYFRTDSASGYGVMGYASTGTGFTAGVYGQADSDDGYGVFGRAPASFGQARGVYGRAESTEGAGVHGYAAAATGLTSGVKGFTASSEGYGVYGRATAASGSTYGVHGRTESPDGTGVWGHAASATGTTYAVKGTASSSDGYAGYFTGGRNYFQFNVGIGTQNPEQLLHVMESDAGVTPNPNAPLVVERNFTTFINILTPDDAESGVLFGNPTDGSAAGGVLYNSTVTPDGLQFRVAGNNTRMVIQSDGKVGIGEENPQATLHVGGTPEVDGIMFPDGTLQTTAATSDDGLWIPSGSYIYHDAGNVGIGWAGGAYPLDVRSSTGITLHARNASTGTAISAVSNGGSAIIASALGGAGITRGIAAEAFNPDGFAIYGVNEGEEGNSCAIYGETFSPDGFAGYFVGAKNYFQGRVGIGEENPQTTLHLGGADGFDGIIFPDGTLQTTAAVGGSGDSLWSELDGDIFYTAGSVGIGTSTPMERLHVSGDTRIDGVVGIDTAPNIFAQVLVDTDTLVGVRASTTFPNVGTAVWGEATADTGDARGVWGISSSPEGFGVLGEATAETGDSFGVSGHAVSPDGTGVYGLHDNETGTEAGVHGITHSNQSGAAGVRGEAIPDAGAGGTIYGVRGTSMVSNGIGVSGTGAAAGVAGITYVPDGVGVSGFHGAGTGDAPGVRGSTDSTSDYAAGVKGEASSTSSSAMTVGVHGASHAGLGIGVYGESDYTASATTTYGGYFVSQSDSGVGVRGVHDAITGDAPGVYGTTNAATDNAAGVKGEATSTSSDALGIGVIGISHSGEGVGVYGHAVNAGSGTTTYGGYFVSDSEAGWGVTGVASGANAFAGFFLGRAYFSGNVGLGTSSPQARLDVAGTARCDVLQIDSGADLSENFAVAGQPEPGMVVVIDSDRPGGLCVSDRAYDRRVAGIISGAGGVQTGMLMSQAGSVADGDHPVALTGRVYCRCDASNAAIEPGDMLTTSETPGHAMKVADYPRAQGAIIGKAMTSLKQGETGLVLVLVNLQ